MQGDLLKCPVSVGKPAGRRCVGRKCIRTEGARGHLPFSNGCMMKYAQPAFNNIGFFSFHLRPMRRQVTGVHASMQTGSLCGERHQQQANLCVYRCWRDLSLESGACALPWRMTATRLNPLCNYFLGHSRSVLLLMIKAKQNRLRFQCNPLKRMERQKAQRHPDFSTGLEIIITTFVKSIQLDPLWRHTPAMRSFMYY